MLTRESMVPSEVRASLWKIDQRVDELLTLVRELEDTARDLDHWQFRSTIPTVIADDVINAQVEFTNAIRSTDSNLANLAVSLGSVRDHIADTRRFVGTLRFDSYNPDKWMQRGFSKGLSWDSPDRPTPTLRDGFDTDTLGDQTSIRKAHVKKWQQGFEAGYAERKALGHECRLHVIDWTGFSNGLL